VLFSQFERRLYAESLRLTDDRMSYVPYGNLNDSEPDDPSAPLLHGLREGEFFFSGGYSNRDYLSLIEVFGELPYELVIVCSALNTEISESNLPANIRVLREVPSGVFDSYVKAARACIIPIAHDTGAAGQSCLLRYMKHRKIIIATNTGIIREYVQDKTSGILVKDNRSAMRDAIRAVATTFPTRRQPANATNTIFPARQSPENWMS
jgi:glycosyltransferase involved in cell wall biosynthesis